MRYILASLGMLILLSLGAAAFFNPLAPASPPEIHVTRTIATEDTIVQVAVADTEGTRTRGLSGYAPLEEDQGMLFVFEDDGVYSFWMKDMLFPLDILWLDASGRVVHIEQDVAPATYPASFTPDSAARYVLEVPAGFATEHEIGVGSKFSDFSL